MLRRREIVEAHLGLEAVAADRQEPVHAGMGAGGGERLHVRDRAAGLFAGIDPSAATTLKRPESVRSLPATEARSFASAVSVPATR